MKRPTLTIYSLRTALGQELWWTTNRGQAVTMAGRLKRPGDFVSPGQGARVITATAIDLPVTVYVCKPRVDRRGLRQQLAKTPAQRLAELDDHWEQAKRNVERD